MNEMVSVAVDPHRVRLRVEDYLTLDAAGAFAAYAKTELFDGEVVYVNAQHRPHVRAKMALYEALRDAVQSSRSALTVMVEASVSLTTHDTPEPDLILTNEPLGEGLVPGASVALVIEVADTTLAFDLGPKARLYASAAVLEYWVVDLGGRVIHQMWSSRGEVFDQHLNHAFGEEVIAQTIAGLRVQTHDL